MTDDRNHPPGVRLSRSDAALWDALFEGRNRAQAESSSDVTMQAERLRRLMSLLDACPVENPSADLVQRTLSRIQQQEDRRRFAMQVDALVTPDPAFRWRELSAVAAVLMIGFAVMWPVLSQARQDARRIACQQNLGVAGQGLSRYAADHAGMMPRYAGSSSASSASWAGVGYQGHASDLNAPVVQSNPAHLYILVRKGYVSPSDLACPDNACAPQRMTAGMRDWPNAAAVSYSYQNQLTPKALRLDTHPQMVVLADKNPLFSASLSDPRLVVYRPDLLPSSATVFHQQSGQNMLSGNGQVRWSNRPVTLNGDNIWTAVGVEHYTGTESPTHEADSFLVP